jgi:hypothetical protein
MVRRRPAGNSARQIADDAMRNDTTTATTRRLALDGDRSTPVRTTAVRFAVAAIPPPN